MTSLRDLRNRSLLRAQEITAGYRNDPPPFSLTQLLRQYHISDVRETVLDRDARLLRDRSGFVIEVNGAVSGVRRRMSVAHEIAHLIINEVAGTILPHGSLEAEIEHLCNDLAGELLCPRDAIFRHFERQPGLSDWSSRIRCQSVMEAARRFSVSVDVMAKRIFCDLGMVPYSVAVIWRHTRNTKTDAAKSALRVASAWHSRGKEVFIPLNKTAPMSSVVARAFERDGSFYDLEHLELGTLRGRCEIEAAGFMSFPLRSLAPPSRAVLSLIVPKAA